MPPNIVKNEGHPSSSSTSPNLTAHKVSSSVDLDSTHSSSSSSSSTTTHRHPSHSSPSSSFNSKEVSSRTGVDEDGRPRFTGEGPSPNYVEVRYQQPHWERKRLMLAKYPQLRALSEERDASSAVYSIAILAIQIVAALWLERSQASALGIFALAYTLGATVVHATWVLIHDATHNAVFHSVTANKVLLLVQNFNVFLPSTFAFRHYHLAHHTHLNERYEDPDLPSLWEDRLFGHTALGKAVWLLFFPVWQTLRTARYMSNPAHSRGMMNAWLVVNFVTMFAFEYWTFAYCGPRAFAYMLASAFFAIGLHPLGARWVAEHYAFQPLQETYSVYGAVNLITFNIGYHNEHHDHATVPWSRLPEVRRIAGEFYNGLVYHTSYVSILKDFIFDKNFTLRTRVVRGNGE